MVGHTFQCFDPTVHRYRKDDMLILRTDVNDRLIEDYIDYIIGCSKISGQLHQFIANNLTYEHILSVCNSRNVDGCATPLTTLIALFTYDLDESLYILYIYMNLCVVVPYYITNTLNTALHFETIKSYYNDVLRLECKNPQIINTIDAKIIFYSPSVIAMEGYVNIYSDMDETHVFGWKLPHGNTSSGEWIRKMHRFTHTVKV
jgi:hypothetical protein